MATGGIVNFCKNCGKKPLTNGKRIINQLTATCNECAPNNDDETSLNHSINEDEGNSNHNIDDNETLNNVTFGALKAWLTETNNSLVSQLERKLTAEITKVKEDLETTKTTVSDTKTDLDKLQKEFTKFKTACNTSIKQSDERCKKLEDESKRLKTVSDNNLKYLINSDRNHRRQNIVVMGVPEIGSNMEVNGVVCVSDMEKCKGVLDFIETPIFEELKEQFRLGKTITPGKPRPIKLICASSAAASNVLKASKKLKDLPDQTIYIKPDKTKSEIAEYQRLGKHKKELEETYPVHENGNKRVILEKGVLKVDGVQVDEFKSIQSLF